jgi:hypothetical protein
MRTLFVTAILAASASIASADTVILKNGGKLTGVTTRIEGDKLIVKTQSGTVKFDHGDILKVIHKVTPMEAYEQKAGDVKKGDAEGHVKLADWCAQNDLDHFERVELEAAIAADKDHAEARRRLGYEKVGAEWLRGEALLKARGMVKREGKWVTAEAAKAMDAERERVRLEKALRAAEAKEKAAEKEDELDRAREFYDSMRRYSPRRDEFQGQRAPRSYPRYRSRWYQPFGYGGSYYQVGTYAPYVLYPYGYGYGHHHHGYGGSSIGFRYSGSHGSFTFGTNFYGYGHSHGYYGGSYYGPGYYGGGYYAPASGGYSSVNFNKGGLAPGYGGYAK